MKTAFSLCAAVLLMLSFITTQSLSSCTKETVIQDTIVIYDTVNHHDTSIIYLHDTTQLTIEACLSENEGYVNSYVDYINSNANGVNQLSIASWTHNSLPE